MTKYIVETFVVALLVIIFVNGFHRIDVRKSKSLIAAALIIGFLNSVLSFLTELPLTFTGYLILSVVFRLAVIVAVLKFIEDFFSGITAKKFMHIVIISLPVALIASLLTYFLGT